MQEPTPPSPTSSGLRDGLGLVAFLGTTFAVAAGAGWLTSLGVSDWYPTVAKPPWTPPGWLFGPVWTGLYLAMAVAAWLVWRRGGLAVHRGALSLWALQLLLNGAWSGLFFTLREPGWALAEILLLTLAVAVTLVTFARTSRLAAGLMGPYLLWVLFATALNAAIWWLNR